MSTEAPERAQPPASPKEPGPPGYYCNATTRQGAPCRNRAGYKTSHVGEGRCHLHGGKTPVKHGLYSKLDRYDLGDRIAELRERDTEELLDLRNQLAVQVAVVERFLEELAGQETLSEEEAKVAVDLLDKIGRQRHRLEKVEREQSIPAEQVNVILNQVVALVREEAGSDVAERIGRRLVEVDPAEENAV